MEMHSILPLVLIVLFCSVLVIPLFQRAGLGSVLGYLLIGSALGPNGLGFFYDVHSVMGLAEMGVVFLLFVIGLELKPKRLWSMRSAVFGLGTVQVLFTSLLLALAMKALGLSWLQSLIAAAALSLSSTALSLQILSERNQLNTSFGRSAFAILLFQDIAAIPLLTIIPLLSPGFNGAGFDWKRAVLPILVLVAMVAVGRYLLRPWFRFAASARMREVFTSAGLLVVLGSAMLMENLGLSMALGTFLAGILLSDSEFRHELETDLEPFKGLLLGLFFMAVGMSVDYAFLLERPLLILAMTFAWMGMKFILLYFLGKSSGQSAMAAVSLAQALCMGGEFAFVLFGAAEKSQLLDHSMAQTLSLTVTLSMVLTPLIYFLRDKAAFQKNKQTDFDALPTENPQVILAGFGRVGQVVGRLLRIYEIPYVALELDPDQVDLVRRFGGEIFYGDASRLDLLERAGAKNAKLFVLAVDDVESSIQVARMVKEKFPQLRILARARNRTHAFELYNMGVEDVFRETFGTSLEIAESTLVALGFENAKASGIIQTFRKHDEKSLQEQRAYLGDEKSLIRVAKQSVEQLSAVLKSDRIEKS